MLFNHHLDRLHDLEVSLEVGVYHGLLFLLIVVSFVIAVALLTTAARGARSALVVKVAADNGRVEDGLARLGVEDERGQEQTLDELDERVAFLSEEKRACAWAGLGTIVATVFGSGP